VDQAIEHLLCKCEVLSSNHSPTEKDKRRKGKKEGRKGRMKGGNKAKHNGSHL
jgi:hypothetical protein